MKIFQKNKKRGKKKKKKERIDAAHSFQVELLKQVTSVLEEYPNHKTYL